MAAPADIRRKLEQHLPMMKQHAAGLMAAHYQKRYPPEDIAQDICVSVWQHFGKNGGEWPMHEEAYLRMAVRRRVYAVIKQLHGEKIGGAPLGGSSSVDALAGLYVDSETPSRALRKEERARRVLDALPYLPKQAQEALWLTQVEKRTRQEVAIMLQLSETELNNLIYSAKQELRSTLGSISFSN